MSSPAIPVDKLTDQLERLEVATRQLRRVMGNMQQLMASIERRLDELQKTIENPSVLNA
jgi:prefoldin subunit 5